jgi:hypothetical protein
MGRRPGGTSVAKGPRLHRSSAGSRLKETRHICPGGRLRRSSTIEHRERENQFGRIFDANHSSPANTLESDSSGRSFIRSSPSLR